MKLNRRDFLTACGAFAATTALARPIRSDLAGIGSALGDSNGWDDSTAKLYIQDGLVALWDGIENIGWGVHDSDSLFWKDLVGDNDLTSENPFNDISLVCPGTYATYRDSASFAYGDILQTEISLNYPYPLANRMIASFLGTRRVFANANLSRGGISLGYNDYGYGAWPSGKHTFSASYDGNFSTGLSIDSVNKDRVEASDSWTALSGIRIGAVRGNVSRNEFVGNVYCIRLYSRNLTPEEIAYNYSIDQMRFGL